MAKLLKIKEVVRCCEECLMCKENYIEVMTEDTYLACDHPLSPKGNEIDCEDLEGFPKWCPLNDYPYDVETRA